MFKPRAFACLLACAHLTYAALWASLESSGSMAPSSSASGGGDASLMALDDDDDDDDDEIGFGQGSGRVLHAGGNVPLDASGLRRPNSAPQVMGSSSSFNNSSSISYARPPSAGSAGEASAGSPPTSALARRHSHHGMHPRFGPAASAEGSDGPQIAAAAAAVSGSNSAATVASSLASRGGAPPPLVITQPGFDRHDAESGASQASGFQSKMKSHYANEFARVRALMAKQAMADDDDDEDADGDTPYGGGGDGGGAVAADEEMR